MSLLSDARRPRTAPRLRGYEPSWLRRDLLAGLTVWAVLIPEALAYASIAGVPPVVGLYAAPPALALYAVLGSSRLLVVGPMSATAALSAAAVADLTTGGPDDVLSFTCMLAIVTGLLALAAGLLRLGFVANLVSEPVLKGFIIGLALTIVAGQVPTLLGIEKEGDNFFEQVGHVVWHLADAHGPTLLVGVGSLVSVLMLRRFVPAVPASLVAVAAGVSAVAAFDLDGRGVAVVGQIDAGLPAVGLPDGRDAQDYVRAVGAALGIMVVGYVEGLGAAKSYAARTHENVDANRELVALGAANVGAGLATGMVVNGSLSKTAVNAGAGARSQVAGLMVAALTIITLLFLTPLFERLPEATLAAVVIAAVVELVDIGSLRDLQRRSTRRLGRIYGAAARADFIGAVAALIGVLVLDTLPGLLIGVGVSLLLLLYRASRPYVAELGHVPRHAGLYADVDRHPECTEVPGVQILRIESGLFFANAESVRQQVLDHAARPGVRAVVMDAQSVAFVDVTAVRVLDDLAAELRARGQRLVIAHELGQVRDLHALESGEDVAVSPTIDDALAALGVDVTEGGGPHDGTVGGS